MSLLHTLKKYVTAYLSVFFLHPDVHPSAVIYRSETSATLYPWDTDLGFMARFNFGYDDYNYRFVDNYPRFSIGLTWDWFTPN